MEQFCPRPRRSFDVASWGLLTSRRGCPSIYPLFYVVLANGAARDRRGNRVELETSSISNVLATDAAGFKIEGAALVPFVLSCPYRTARLKACPRLHRRG